VDAGADAALPQESGDLLAGHWALLQRFGMVPKVLVWDNESAVGSWRAGRPQLTAAFRAFAGTLGVGVVQCRPGDPEAKGLVERANGYLETSFLPGRAFSGPGDFNTQLSQWIAQTANRRQHRTLGCRPADRWPADQDAMLSLPPVAPITGWQEATRLPRDHYVRLAGNDYSVHPGAIGRLVEVRAGLDIVSVTCGGELVASHPRCWARHQTITDPAHQAAAAAMRQAHRASTQPGSGRAGLGVEVGIRALSDYDQLFGLATDRACEPDGGQQGQVA
jgi:Integrase core domain